MKANRTRFSKVKMAWELKKMISAYVGAERFLIDEAAQSMGLYSPEQYDPLNAKKIYEDSTSIEEWIAGSNMPNLSEKDKLYRQAQELRKQINQAIAEENFEKAAILDKTLKVIEIKYNKIK